VRKANAFAEADGQFRSREPLAAHEAGKIAGTDKNERFALHGWRPLMWSRYRTVAPA
jgi:hypothetical protein